MYPDGPHRGTGIKEILQLSDSITFKCRRCGVSLKMNKAALGVAKQSRCPSCKQWIPLPDGPQEKDKK
jgi:predicted Zn-ribbon and HTH transcriptional regulator